MPRKKKIEEDEDIEIQQRVVEVDPQDSKVRRLMQMMPGGLKCMQVFRYNPGSKGGRPTYIDDISPEQFDFKTLKTMFGGGKFQVKWDNEDGSISKGDFDIAGPYINFDTQPEQERILEPAQVQRPMMQPTQVQPSQNITPMDMLRMIQEARREAREEMRSMLELMRPQQQSPDVTKQVFEIVEKIAPMMAGGDGGGSPWMMALTQFKEPILKIVDSIQIALQRPSVVPSGPPPQVHAHVQPNPSQPPSEDDMLKLLIRQYLPVFVNAARSNGNPDIYADMILEQIPETMYTRLQQWLEGSWFQDIVAIEKNIEFQAGWWNLLKTSLLEGMKEHAASNVQSSSDSEHSED